VVSWRERLFPHDQTIKIGLYWNDPALAGALLEGLADIPGVTFLDLKGEISAGNIVPIPGLGDVPANYSPVLDVLDMVVAEESWVLHLAGALGRTAWGVLPEDHGWCWGRGDHSPWYPRTLLFRRRQGREWHEVAAGIRALLEQVMGDVLSEQGATGNNE
jgi:hypothetical protein